MRFVLGEGDSRVRPLGITKDVFTFMLLVWIGGGAFTTGGGSSIFFLGVGGLGGGSTTGGGNSTLGTTFGLGVGGLGGGKGFLIFFFITNGTMGGYLITIGFSGYYNLGNFLRGSKGFNSLGS